MKVYITVRKTYFNQVGSPIGGAVYWYAPRSTRELTCLKNMLKEWNIIYNINTIENIPQSNPTWNQINNIEIKEFCKFINLILSEDLDLDYI